MKSHHNSDNGRGGRFNNNNCNQHQSNNNSNYNGGRRNIPRRHQSMGILSYQSNNNNSFQSKSFRKPNLNRSASGNYDPLGGNSSHSSRSLASGGFQHSYKKPVMPPKQQYLAMDCEMVGTVTGESVAARVVLIDWKGRPVFDKHMKPEETVTDYRTFVSGITEGDLKDAAPFVDVVQEVKDMLKEKILVGHGLDNDLRALGIEHAWLMMRDTAYYQPFMRQLETSTFNNRNMSQIDGQPIWGPRKLKELAKEKLQRDIQVPGKSHCPIEDAAAALDLYKSHRPRWEACMSTEERQQKQRQAYEAAVLAYEQYHAQLAFASNGPPSRSASGDDLSAVSMHSYFPPNNTSAPQQQYQAPPDLHTGYQQHRVPPGLSRENSYQSGSSTMSLGAHSYHGAGAGGSSFNFHNGHQPQQQVDSNMGLRLYERTSSLTPGQIQRQLSLGSSPQRATGMGASSPLLRQVSASSSTGFALGSSPAGAGYGSGEDYFPSAYDIGGIVSPSY